MGITLLINTLDPLLAVHLEDAGRSISGRMFTFWVAFWLGLVLKLEADVWEALELQLMCAAWAVGFGTWDIFGV